MPPTLMASATGDNTIAAVGALTLLATASTSPEALTDMDYRARKQKRDFHCSTSPCREMNSTIPKFNNNSFNHKTFFVCLFVLMLCILSWFNKK